MFSVASSYAYVSGSPYRIRVRHDGLRVEALHFVLVPEREPAFPIGLVVHEGPVVHGSVGEDPLPLHQLVLVPGAFELKLVGHSYSHGSVVEHVGALAVLLVLVPLARVDVLVGVGVEALAVAHAELPLAVVLAFEVGVDHLADAVAGVLVVVALVAVLVGVGVLSLAVALAVDVKPLVGVAICVTALELGNTWPAPCRCSRGWSSSLAAPRE